MKVVSTEALTRFLTVIKGDLAKKEPSITKKSAFNLDKTDTAQNNRDLLFTSKGALDLKTEITNLIDAKMNTSGGTFTGPISMSGSNTVNITHNYGIKSYLSNGSLDYVLYVNTSDQLVLGFNGRPITTQGTITSPTFIGALQGKSDNSKAADKLANARNITIGNKTSSFDGSSNISYSLSDIGASEKISYSSTIKCLKWSRILHCAGESVFGGSYFIKIKGTRNSVVYNQLFSVTSGHSNKCHITQLNGSGYSEFNLRGVVTSTGEHYIEIYDNATNGAQDQNQSIGVDIVKMDNVKITPYTSFTDGTTIPSGWLTHEIRSKSDGVVSQEFYATGGNNKVYHPGNKPSLADLGAFSSSGGTINGNTNITGNLAVSGNINGSKTYNAVWNDYAEFFPKVKGYKTEPGDIIALSLIEEGEVYELATDKHKLIAGVHSDQYGHLIGGENPENGEDYVEYNKDKYIPVGLAGRVPVKFTGVAEKGMKVVPSDIPGVGREFMFGDNYENVIGYIVENNYEEGIRRVKIKIGK
ncbi:MAG: hypothetical protein ACRCVH_11825 [Vagococcus fluvialis]